MPLRLRLRKGLDLPIAGPPEQILHEGPRVSSVGLCGSDFVEIRPRMQVQEGDRVRLGQPLFVDRRSPRVLFVSPGAGLVKSIHHGPRRVLQSLVVQLEGDEETTFFAYSNQDLAALDREAVRENLLVSGLWTALRARPHGRIPDPDTAPNSIFVTALDTSPLAPDPRVVLEDPALFLDGLRVVSRLTEGPVYLCVSPGLEIPDVGIPGLRLVIFEGPHPAGLVGTHIHFLDPVGAKKTVWYLDYQEVVAMGSLFRTGRYPVGRVAALAGPSVMHPRVLRTRRGANTRDLVRGQLREDEVRIISGSILSGRTATEPEHFLGPYHSQVSVIPEGFDRNGGGFFGFGRRPFSVHGRCPIPWRSGRRYRMRSASHGPPAALLAMSTFESCMPLDILPTPLLRALTVGDREQAEALGCLELVEEDLALCSFLCPGKLDYGPLLRSVLERIEGERSD